MKNASITSTSGSGIYAGRLAALDVFFSETPTTNILIADVPINLSLPSTQNAGEDGIVTMRNLSTTLIMNDTAGQSQRYDKHLDQEDMKLFTTMFLDFSKHLSYNGTICNGDFCCSYDIDAIDNGSNDQKVNEWCQIKLWTWYQCCFLF